jgi:hypothetical protein
VSVSFIIVLNSLRILWQPSHQRQRLINAIEKHHVLRCVAGYPLLPDLELTADSVIQALGTLGPNIALASVNLDMFKAHFISEYEAMNVVAPMDHALARKRNASEINS